MLKYAVVIPARYKSTRFPGKPLADIQGKPMIQHVWERCVVAVGSELTYVATDDERIARVVRDFGGQIVMTSEGCLTGTDRLAEANRSLGCDFVINVQGDEPMVCSDDILRLRDRFLEDPTQVVNAYTEISEKEDPFSRTLPKVVVSTSGRLMYMSRAAIPLDKAGSCVKSCKQVCIYVFSRAHLEFYASFTEKAAIEQIEDIEILRFLEHDVAVSMVKVENVGMAVDTLEDLAKVREQLG
jgi:3-deoxy-manno-octulosonate cytidylyltransferase (CMP-KDO synthetase)